jgi:hypothetical protein
LAAQLEGCTQTPKHGKNYAKHDPRSLAQLTDRSTNSTPDEVFATHTDDLSHFDLPVMGTRSSPYSF